VLAGVVVGGLGVWVVIDRFIVRQHWRSASDSGAGEGSRGRLFSLRSVEEIGSIMGRGGGRGGPLNSQMGWLTEQRRKNLPGGLCEGQRPVCTVQGTRWLEKGMWQVYTRRRARWQHEAASMWPGGWHISRGRKLRNGVRCVVHWVGAGAGDRRLTMAGL